MVYEWTPGSCHKVDANIAGAVCEQLEAENNLSAKSLLDVSRPEDAPLHSEFEWDDSAAAEKYRESQASHIIRHLAVRLESKPQEPVRGFFQVKRADPHSYTRLGVILTQHDARAELMRKALAELDSFQRKYNTLSELAGIFSAVNALRLTLEQE